MRVPLSWLKDYVAITLPAGELAERLTMAGLEVAAIERIGERWDPEKIRVGEVLEVRPHPNADRLTIVVVDYGASEPQAVVTGAPNIHVGDTGLKVVFASEGAELIDGHSEKLRYIRLKPTRIRGVRSAGMVCSEKELGLSDDHTGVVILPDDAPVGMPLREYMGDVIFDLDITPNLSHCFCVIGIAREVAALTKQTLRIPDPNLVAEGEDITGQIEIEIADPDLCARYSAGLIKGVRIGPSPFWMQRRLTMAGMRPINNIVDVTNYVMLEYGQPLHAFDYRKLRGRRPGDSPIIIVRRAKPGEKITTLDGIERTLNEEMLLITDGKGAVAIAGVMGGLESEVTDETSDILLESANFDNINNRRTSQALKLSSEASLRFGKGVDPELTTRALERALELMRQLAGGTVARGFADAYPVRPSPKVIEFDSQEVDRLLGIHIENEEILRILNSLEFRCEPMAGNAQRFLVTVPSHRLDVSIPADLVEEVGRIHGYEKIPLTLLEDELPPQRRNWAVEREEQVRDILVGCGLTEVITYSLTNLESVAKLTPEREEIDPDRYIRIANPLSSEREYMRQTLMNTMLETLAENRRFADRIALFEIARVYLPVEGEVLPREPRRLCIAMSGRRSARSWLEPEGETFDFFDLKGVIETLLQRLNIAEAVFRPTDHPTFHQGRVAQLLVKEKTIGVLGEVHPLVREAFDLPAETVCLAEFDLEALLGAIAPTHYMQPISRYPAVRQDLAVIVDEDVPAHQVEAVIWEAGGALLVDVLLFDLYRGEPIPMGKKSLAYSLTFQSRDHTLKDNQVAKVWNRIVKQLKRRIGAELRG